MPFNTEFISSVDDPRLIPYRNLRERTLRGESAFIAEGRLVTERLLESVFPVQSLLISSEALSALDSDFIRKIGSVPVYAVSEKEMLSSIAGFPFHQGMLALGTRIPLPSFPEAVKSHGSRPGIWVVLPDATKPDNLGLAFRSAAALGAAGVVLGERCCDPFSRRALRVSMGGVLQVPVIQALHLRQEISAVRASSDLRFAATVLDPQAVPLPQYSERPERIAVLFGNEYTGLEREDVDLCDTKLIIPMAENVDSLNLGVSVGIFLYELKQPYRQAVNGIL